MSNTEVRDLPLAWHCEKVLLPVPQWDGEIYNHYHSKSMEMVLTASNQWSVQENLWKFRKKGRVCGISIRLLSPFTLPPLQFKVETPFQTNAAKIVGFWLSSQLPARVFSYCIEKHIPK